MRRFGLTEPERLGLLFTTVRGVPAAAGAWLVVFHSSPLALSDNWAVPRQLPGLGDPIDVYAEVAGRRADTVEASAWPLRPGTGLSESQRDTLWRALETTPADHALVITGDSSVDAMGVWPRWSRSRDRRDSRRSVAATVGPTWSALMAELVPPGSAEQRRPAGADQPGWVSVPLGVACPSCGCALALVDHHYPGLAWNSSRHVIVCSSGQCQDRGYEGHEMVVAYRQLSASLPQHAADSGKGTNYTVYVIEAERAGDRAVAYYVGETAKAAEARFDEHATGLPAARVFRTGRYTPVRLRPDLIPELPPLWTRFASEAAEQFVAAVLRWRGRTVLGGT